MPIPTFAAIAAIHKSARRTAVHCDTAELAESEPAEHSLHQQSLTRGCGGFVTDVLVGGAPAGVVTAGAMSPYLGHGIGIALLESAQHGVGTLVEIQCKDGSHQAGELVELPMYDQACEIPCGKQVAIPYGAKADCEGRALKSRCCPNQPVRKILRSIHEGARDMARDIAETDEYEISSKLRKKVEMLFAHLKRILGLGRLRLRRPTGARDEFHLAAIAQNLRKLAKLLPMPTENPEPV